jgi:hypothetical protein
MSTVRRRFWQGIEVVHDVVYFAPAIRERFEAIGLKGWWMAYFAQRAAAVGTPGPELVTALFHGFAPRLVRRALPDAWAMADRDEILATRLQLARDQLAPVVDPAAMDTAVADLGEDLAAIVRGLDFAGRPLAAAHASVVPPEDPIGRLWWAATVLREYRGDSHVAVLVTSGLDGAAANALAVADGRAPTTQQQARGWDDDEWTAAYGDLQLRGWVDANRAITEAGRASRTEIEHATDRASDACFDTGMQALADGADTALVDLARAINAAGAVTFPNPTATLLP